MDLLLLSEASAEVHSANLTKSTVCSLMSREEQALTGLLREKICTGLGNFDNKIRQHPDTLMMAGRFRNGSGQREISSNDRQTDTFHESHGSSIDWLIFTTLLPSPTIISGFLMEGFLNALITAFGTITRTDVFGSPWRAHPFDIFSSSGYTATLNSPNRFSICPPFPLITLSVYCAHLIYSSNFPSHFHIFDHKNLGKR